MCRWLLLQLPRYYLAYLPTYVSASSWVFLASNSLAVPNVTTKLWVNLLVRRWTVAAKVFYQHWSLNTLVQLEDRTRLIQAERIFATKLWLESHKVDLKKQVPSSVNRLDDFGKVLVTNVSLKSSQSLCLIFGLK